jgi:integrase
MLYWCGLREEELFALTSKDFDFEKKTLVINKTFTVIKGEPIVSLSKTQSGLRTVTIPEFLCKEMERLKEFLKSQKHSLI